jgi:hypothetical protein
MTKKKEYRPAGGGLWGWLLPNTAREMAKRQHYAVSERGSVERDAEKGDRLVLRYYPRSDSHDLASIPLDDIETGTSRNDQSEKLLSTALLVLFAIAPMLMFFLEETLARFGLADEFTNHFTFVAIAAALSAFFLVVVVFLYMRVNFTEMDTSWRNAIREFLDDDMRNKLFGLRKCLLEFRRFIKWRRYMTYVTYPMLVLYIAQFPIFFWLEWRFEGYSWSRNEAILAGVFVTAQFFTQAWYSYLRWYYTNWRDPTLQLCVMVAEENRKFVGLLRRGIRM